MIRLVYFCVAVPLVLIAGSCANSPPCRQPRPSEEESAGARLSKTEAIQIAERAAERLGVNWHENAPPVTRFYVEKVKHLKPKPSFGDHIWHVYFAWGPKTNFPGGDFWVYVDDITGETLVERGH